MNKKLSKSYEKRRNTPRLPIVYTTAEILQKLDYLAGIHGSKKAAIEMAIVMLFDRGAKSDALKNKASTCPSID